MILLLKMCVSDTQEPPSCTFHELEIVCLPNQHLGDTKFRTPCNWNEMKCDDIALKNVCLKQKLPSCTFHDPEIYSVLPKSALGCQDHDSINLEQIVIESRWNAMIKPLQHSRKKRSQGRRRGLFCFLICILCGKLHPTQRTSDLKNTTRKSSK